MKTLKTLTEAQNEVKEMDEEFGTRRLEYRDYQDTPVVVKDENSDYLAMTIGYMANVFNTVCDETEYGFEVSAV